MAVLLSVTSCTEVSLFFFSFPCVRGKKIQIKKKIHDVVTCEALPERARSAPVGKSPPTLAGSARWRRTGTKKKKMMMRKNVRKRRRLRPASAHGKRCSHACEKPARNQLVHRQETKARESERAEATAAASSCKENQRRTGSGQPWAGHFQTMLEISHNENCLQLSSVQPLSLFSLVLAA